MNARSNLLDLIARGSAAGLLNSCRLARGGVETYGAEAIGADYRTSPWRTDGDEDWSEAENHVALVGVSGAIFADVHDGWIGRIWHVEPSAPRRCAEPAMPVAFDIDLVQARGDLLLRSEDHPTLTQGAVERVCDLGRSVAGQMPHATAFRTRAFLLRAFGDEARGAALFAVHRLGADPVRTSDFSHAIAVWRRDEASIVVDAPGLTDMSDPTNRGMVKAVLPEDVSEPSASAPPSAPIR